MHIGTCLATAHTPFCSMEFFPPSDATQLPEFYETVHKLRELQPLFVSVTYGAGGKRPQNTLDVTAELVRQGMNVMAHLTCVMAERASILTFLDALQAAGVDNVLALRGDPPKDRPWNPYTAAFHHAVDLVRFVRTYRPTMGIGVAAYPTPHPESRTYAEDRRHTAEKIRAGADLAITQLFFDARAYVELVGQLRAQGITTPVIPGILPVQSLDSLRRMLSLCGAHIPGTLYLALEKAHHEGGPEAVRQVGLDHAVQLIRRLLAAGAPGIHLYTLNKADMCLRLMEAVGNFPTLTKN